MKHPFRFALAAFALLGALTGLQAQATLKVATVDMEQLFEKYYKTEAHQNKLREDEKKAKDQIESLRKEGEALVTVAKELQEQTKSAILSEDARKKAQSDLEAKVGEIREKENEIQRTVQGAQQILQKRAMQFQQQAVEEISKVATELATKKGATLVLNQSANALVLFADPSFNITDEVLAAINKDRPPAITVPTPAPAPAN